MGWSFLACCLTDARSSGNTGVEGIDAAGEPFSFGGRFILRRDTEGRRHREECESQVSNLNFVFLCVSVPPCLGARTSTWPVEVALAGEGSVASITGGEGRDPT